MTPLHIADVVILCTAYAFGTYVIFSVTYCLWLLLVGLSSKLSTRRPVRPIEPSSRFCVLIPAHNEEVVIASTLQTIDNLNYPKEYFRTIVIADNCSDRTAEIASSFSFVEVLCRTSETERGKGYALNWAIAQILPDEMWDAIVVVDADTSVDKDFLLEMDAGRSQASKGRFVAQGRYDVLNADESWRTALLAGALSLVHVVRPTARQFLGFTVGLKGNGMCFDKDVLSLAPWRGDSLTEDIEQTLDLLEKEEIRVRFVARAKVAALMPTSAKTASSQRERWENGRSQLVKKRAGKLLFLGVVKFRPAYIDAAIDLLIPPLAEMTAALAVWIVLIALVWLLVGSADFLTGLAIYALLGLVTYIIGGFAFAGAPRKAFQALLYAPVYTAWKIILKVKRPASRTQQWVRTSRESDENPSDELPIKSTVEVREH